MVFKAHVKISILLYSELVGVDEGMCVCDEYSPVFFCM